MVDSDDRFVEREAQPLRGLYADQERAGEPRAAGDCDAVDLGRLHASARERLLDDGSHVAQVVARGKLRYHAAIGRVQLDLTVYGVAHHVTRVADERGGGLVARGFDAEHELHEKP